jgi:hypothetical protein
MAVIFALMLAGCPKLANDAYSLIVGAKAFTDKVASQHPECANGATTSVCVNLKKAVAAKDTLIDATEAYCAGPDFNAGGGCNEPAKGTPAATQATAKLQAAIAGWNQASTDLKGATQ